MKIFNKINYYIYNIYIIYIVKFYFPYLPHVSENCHLSSVIVLTFLPSLRKLLSDLLILLRKLCSVLCDTLDDFCFLKKAITFVFLLTYS